MFIMLIRTLLLTCALFQRIASRRRIPGTSKSPPAISHALSAPQIILTRTMLSEAKSPRECEPRRELPARYCMLYMRTGVRGRAACDCKWGI